MNIIELADECKVYGTDRNIRTFALSVEQAFRQRVLALLIGIDLSHNEHAEGWWEDGGEVFGAEILKKIKNITAVDG